MIFLEGRLEHAGRVHPERGNPGGFAPGANTAKLNGHGGQKSRRGK